ncbi:hypothetical protein MLD38_032358 [Melastoma candidum]|uniref:Uncharacterized protein n=1 Tax=Melastoma candidum TaxID=119954 RepID=A0ACB9M5U4_9MYRT|nr:hypothetical protein MLD38_032358 [Melastoma candidum]
MPLPRPRSPRRIPCFLKSLLRLSSQRSPDLPRAVELLSSLSHRGTRFPGWFLSLLLRRFSRGPAVSLPAVKSLHLFLKLTHPVPPGTVLGNDLIALYVKCGSLFHARNVFVKMCEKRNLLSWNRLIAGYVGIGEFDSARRLFDEMEGRDAVSWNTMIVGYARSGLCGAALEIFSQMSRCGVNFDEFTFSGILIVCGKAKDTQFVKQVHAQVLVQGYLGNVIISSNLVDAYAKLGELEYARFVFDEMRTRDIFSWTTMVSGYSRQCDIEKARELFVRMPEKNDVSWTSMISGYARNGSGKKALELFSTMLESSVRPNQFTFSSCLCACATIASLKHGKEIHGYLVRANTGVNTIVASSLIDVYSKCDELGSASIVFDRMGDKKDVILWNTMLSALADHGLRERAMDLLSGMVEAGVRPNMVTFSVMMTPSCIFVRLSEEGLRLFDSVTGVECSSPNLLQVQHC